VHTCALCLMCVNLIFYYVIPSGAWLALKMHPQFQKRKALSHNEAARDTNLLHSYIALIKDSLAAQTRDTDSLKSGTAIITDSLAAQTIDTDPLDPDTAIIKDSLTAQTRDQIRWTLALQL